MKFFKSRTNICFLSVIFLIVVALIVCTTIITNNKSDINYLAKQTISAKAKLEETNQRLEDIQKEFDHANSLNTSLSSELEKLEKENAQIKKENNELKKENSSLKSTNKKLNAQKNEAVNQNSTTIPSTGEKICYLTFDDGPSSNTLKILDILKKYNAKATFFVINTKNISYVKKIHDAGHTVGLHTYTHDYSKIYASEKAYFADLKNISDKVKSFTGVETKIMRFPGGSSNKISEKYSKGLMKKLIKSVGKKGYYYFDWNVDSSDAAGNNVSYTKIRDSVLISAKNKNSICVLMHDSEAKKSTVTALPGILKGLKAQGYVFKGLSEKSFGYHHNVS